jgi:hypothetical protein
LEKAGRMAKIRPADFLAQLKSEVSSRIFSRMKENKKEISCVCGMVNGGIIKKSFLFSKLEKFEEDSSWLFIFPHVLEGRKEKFMGETT